MAFLEISRADKGYGQAWNRTDVLADINLEVERGEFIAIVGFSGAGKTTLVSLLSGLAFPDRGSVTFDGKPVTGPGPERGLVFQNYSLLPWLTVFENIALAVDQVFPQWSAEGRRTHVEKYIQIVNLAAARNKLPRELSGGMRQRVAVARTLAMEPQVLLLDEPLSALDALTRANLQDEITSIRRQDDKTIVLITNDPDEAILLAEPFGMLDSLTRYELQEVLIQLWRREKITAMMVTHDVDEALFLSDRIICMTDGPEAGIGEVIDVHFPRPRERRDVMEHPDYYRLRERLIHFLEVKAHKHPVPAAVPAAPAEELTAAPAA